MRVLAACAVLVGCHATAHTPPPIAAAAVAVAVVASRPPNPAPTSTLSFLERVSPYPITVPHVDVALARREGPEAIDELFPVISGYMRECYTTTWLAFERAREDHMTMTIDVRADETNVEIEPANVVPWLATCFAESVGTSHYATRGRVVLAIDARLWLTTTNAQPPP